LYWALGAALGMMLACLSMKAWRRRLQLLRGADEFPSD
jgi:hypothetical protein